MHTLGDEIKLTESYLAIEALRLGERLQLEWQIDQDLIDIEVPSLCIQPLAENAVYHGIEPIAEGGKILISALQIGNRLKLSVSNPLTSDTMASTYGKKGNQMAQDNIRQRLKLVYGNRGEFTINDTKESYTVSILIPLDVKNERFNS
jgi:two-component system sensor histidine kinase AlgZ